jgi:hypothetical protein
MVSAHFYASANHTVAAPFQAKVDSSECLRKEAEKLSHGPQRDELENKARQAETAADIEGWLRSPELQPPK